jgi:glycerol-3-phosphate dehydrogenase
MIYDTVIIGGGVVGLSILQNSLLAGYNAILLERNPNLCDGASGRNSGVICTGVDAPSGSLERALIRDSISRVREFCVQHNVPMRECGSLVCLWPWDDDHRDNNITEEEDVDEKKIDDDTVIPVTKPTTNEKLERVLQESHIAGDNGATLLSPEAVLKLEPSLSSQCRGAVHIPGEIVVDPWLFPLALATHARELGRKSIHGGNNDVIQTGREVIMDASSFNTEEGVWNLVTRGEKDNEEVVFKTKTIINAVGVDTDLMQKSASSVVRDINPPTFAARPRRGQYIVYSAPLVDDVPTRPIQPVPTDRTKGIFVYSTLYNQIVVGPTAKDQSSRTDDRIEKSVAKELAAHATRVFDRSMGSSSIPSDADFDPAIVGEYVGIRPGTSKRDYQIQLHCNANFITVGGIRSTGLSASLGIGRHVVQSLLCSIVSRSEEELASLQHPSPTPLPDVESLVEQYHRRGDGTIYVDGHDYKVTHPLTRMGWDARTGIASMKHKLLQ